MTHAKGENNNGEEPRVVVHDRRRIDPETGEVRATRPVDAKEVPAAEAPAGTPAPADDVQRQLDERTADLQRLTAEYANYRKRVDRDREVVVNNAKALVATELLSVLDDIERAEAHGDLNGAFKAVADKLVDTLKRVGLEPFGHEGEPFDPSVHEAVQHATSSEVDGPTVTAVLRRGYRFGERLVRAALVGVTDHEPGAASDVPAVVEEPPVVQGAPATPTEPVPSGQSTPDSEMDWFAPTGEDKPSNDNNN